MLLARWWLGPARRDALLRGGSAVLARRVSLSYNRSRTGGQSFVELQRSAQSLARWKGKGSKSSKGGVVHPVSVAAVEYACQTPREC